MKFLAILGVIFVMILCGVGGFAGWVYWQIPSEKEIKSCLITTMYKVELCPGSKTYVPLKSISPYLQKTVVLTEDSAFFQHDGFDWKSIEENAKKNMEKGAYAKGGSTISQQLAKNMFLYKDKTLMRKGLEFLITRKIEQTLTKKEILERYLNVVEFGKEIYGVKQAAQFYFKKSPAHLDIVESAFLAMVLPNPPKYSQSYFKKELTPFAHKRLKRIVNDLYQYHQISEAEYQGAISKVDGFFSPSVLPSFLDELDAMEKRVETDGAEINKTTLEELESIELEENLNE